MIALFALAALAISPWHGDDLPTAVSQTAAKYRLTVAAKPASVVHLSASDVAPGWIAAFCDARVCSPMQTTQKIPSSGSVVLQFELIRETQDAPHTSGALIRSSDGRVVTVPIASR